jgi:hypothetical protein
MSIDAEGRQQFAQKKQIADHISQMLKIHHNIRLADLLKCDPNPYPENQYNTFKRFLTNIKKEELAGVTNIAKIVLDLAMKEDLPFVLRALAEEADETNLVRYLRQVDPAYISYIMPYLPQVAYVEKCICKTAPSIFGDKVFCSNPDCIIHKMKMEANSIDEWNERICKTLGKPYEKKETVVSEPVIPGLEPVREWAKEDEEKLEFLFKAGKTVEDLTEIFNTSQDNIEETLLRLGVVVHVLPELNSIQGHDNGSI